MHGQGWQDIMKRPAGTCKVTPDALTRRSRRHLIRRAPLTEKAIESMRAKALAAGEALTSALRGN